MKDIKLVILDKYLNKPYKEVVHGIYHNEEKGNYCFCFEADEIEQYPLEDIMDMYLLNCAEYCGQSVTIGGETKVIAELETLEDKKRDLIQILNCSTMVGKEVVNFTLGCDESLGVRYKDSDIVVNGRKVSVPIISERFSDNGVEWFESYPWDYRYESMFTDGREFTLDIPENMLAEYIHISGDCAYIDLRNSECWEDCIHVEIDLDGKVRNIERETAVDPRL